MKYIFHEDIFSHLFCLVYFCLVLNKTTAATRRVDPLPNNVCSTARLAARPHALLPCARQPRGCHYNWLWPFVMLSATPQLFPRNLARAPRIRFLDGSSTFAFPGTHPNAHWRLFVAREQTCRSSLSRLATLSEGWDDDKHAHAMRGR